MRFLDFIPLELIANKNNSEMKLTLINGSIIQVVGSDNAAQTLVGTNPQGIVFSEWAIANPEAYTFLRPALVYNNAWAIFVSCVVPNTLVIGENGLRRISSLSDSRKEYTPYNKKIYGLGGFHNAQDFYYGGKQKTLKIELTSGYELECTPVHPIWTGTEWKKSAELKVGDLLPIQYGQNILGKGFVFNGFTYYEHGACKWQLDNRGSDDKFFYLLGLIHADGSYDENKVTVTNKKDQQIIDFLHEYGFTTFKDGIHHNLNSTIFMSFLEWAGFKHGAKNKKMPESLLNCTKKQMCYFLQGLFDGDGTSNSCPHKGGTIKLTSTCLDFMKDLQVILLNFGIVSHINSEHKAPTKKVKAWSTIYNLEIQGYFAKVFYEEIGFRLERKQKNKQFLSSDRSNESGNIYPVDISKLDGYVLTKKVVTNPKRITRRLIKKLNENNPHPYLQELLSEKFFYSPIKSITESENEVFDFVIPETHSFFSNGFISHNTPRGRNFFYEMNEIAKNNPKEWFVSTKTVHDTGVISLEEIAKEKAEGLISDDMIEQEYFCSWSAGCEGSFYFRYVNKMILDGRIGTVPFESAFPVHTAWDLGYRDLCVVIFYQCVGAIVRVINVYSNNFQGMEHYSGILTQYADKYGYQYGKHWAPHDISVHDFGTGQSRIEKARSLGIKFQVHRDKIGHMVSSLPKLSLEDGIEAVRSSFQKMWIDEKNCSQLIKSLESYRREWDSQKKVYKENPVHDIHSNFCDAFRYLVLSLTKTRDSQSSPEELDRRYHEAMYGSSFDVPRPFVDNYK